MNAFYIKYMYIFATNIYSSLMFALNIYVIYVLVMSIYYKMLF